LTNVARPDAPQSLSKSCSDKLTMYQCVSLLRGVTTLLISPENAYLATLILPKSQCNTQATTRAFSILGRMKDLSPETIATWLEGYSFQPFSVSVTDLEFEFSRRSDRGNSQLVSNHKSVVWCPYFAEVISNGVLQGRKIFDPRGASHISRRKLWQSVMDISEKITNTRLDFSDYRGVKMAVKLSARRKVKENVISVLQGWIPNDGDDSFSLTEQRD
jgi:tRNA-specific adenosine deaminase 1